MQRFTHLARPIDLRYASNRFAVAVTLAAGLAGFVVSGPAEGLGLGLATFLAWGLGRELDPDRPLSAGVGAAVTALLGVALPPSPAALLMLLLAARLAVRTTGLPPTPFDLAGVAVVAMVFARSPAGWAAGLAVALALVRDAALPDPAPAHHVAWGAAVAVGVTAVAVATRALSGPWETPGAVELTVGAVGLVASLVLPRESPLSPADLTRIPLDGARLRFGRGLVTGALALGAVAGGGPGLVGTAGGWVVLLAVSIATRLVAPRRG